MRERDCSDNFEVDRKCVDGKSGEGRSGDGRRTHRHSTHTHSFSLHKSASSVLWFSCFWRKSLRWVHLALLQICQNQVNATTFDVCFVTVGISQFRHIKQGHQMTREMTLEMAKGTKWFTSLFAFVCRWCVGAPNLKDEIGGHQNKPSARLKMAVCALK